MTRRKRNERSARNSIIALRVSPEERSLIADRAGQAGRCLSAYIADRVLADETAGPEVRPPVMAANDYAMDPALFNELRRIGNNLNQLAHAANAMLPPHARMAVQTMNQLFDTLLKDELLRRRLRDLRMRTDIYGPSPAQARDELQGSGPVRPSRSWKDVS